MGRTPLSVIEERLQQWLGKDWFEEYRVGKASDEGWINAVITNTIEQFKADKQRQKEKDGGSSGTTATRDQLPSNTTQVQQPASAGPAPWETAAAIPGATVALHPYEPSTPFWVLDANNQPTATTAAAISQLFVQGNNVMCVPQNNPQDGWKNASDRGFTKPAPQPVAPPPPPVSAPVVLGPPPVPGAVPSVPSGNAVSQELRATLSGLTA
jgi:hypothetical protein